MLRDRAQWVLHREKVPLNPATFEPADPHDPNNWLSYDDAIAAAQTAGLEVGFTLTSDDPYWCLDIDHCLHGNDWSPLAYELMGRLPGCLIEVSRSGQGLHIWGSGAETLPDARKKKNTDLHIELYDDERFIACTFRYGSTGSEDTFADLSQLANELFPRSKVAHADIPWVDEPAGAIPDDDALITKALKAKGSNTTAFGLQPSFKDLWTCSDTALAYYNGDRSSMDMALLNHLAFWANKNPVRIERLFGKSALVRDKWVKREDYRQASIIEAIVGCQQTYKEGVKANQPGQPDPMLPAGVLPQMRAGYQYLAVDNIPQYFDRCVYVISQHRVLLPNGELVKPDRFRALYGGYVFALDSIGDATTKDAFEAFVSSQAYHFPKVDYVAFRPEVQPWSIFQEQALSFVNAYVPIQMPRAVGDASPFVNHIRALLPNGRDAETLLGYMAACVQYPGVKFQWAPLVQGAEGNGKTLLYRVVQNCLGDRYCALPNPRELAGKFNGWIENKLFAFIDEIKVPGHRGEMLEALKPLVTNEQIPMEKKGVDPVKADNRANLILATNYRDAIPVTVDQRRYAILYTAQQTKQDIVNAGWGDETRYFQKLYGWLRSGGYAIVHEYLATLTIAEDINPAMMGTAPKTTSTDEAIELTRGPIEQEILESVAANRPGFCGGWISSYALDQLLDEKRQRLPRNKRREALESIGYVYHPALQDGRANRLIAADGNTKPRLFIHKDHPDMQVTNPVDRYEDAQRAQRQQLFAVQSRTVPQ